MPNNAECREMFAEMVARFGDAPMPRPLPNSESSRAFLATQEAIAVMYGWTNRVMRSGQAVLRMDAAGFASEASPLLRSMFEQVMALHWIKEQPSDAFQSLWRAWQKEVSKFQEAEAAGWKLTDEVLALIDDLLTIDTDESSKRVDYLLSTRHRAEKWNSGFYHQAVMQAAIRINAETQAKLGRVDVSEIALFNEAFSLSEPKKGAARLRLAENDGSRTYENLHRGARAFADGLYTAIRNPGMHTPPPSNGGEEQIALEQLAAFSLLARWVHRADVEEA